MTKKTKPNQDTRFTLLRITRVHYFYILAYAFSVIIFDTWNLITHEDVARRLTMAGALFVLNTVIWYLCKSRVKNDNFYKGLLIVLIIADIIFASADVYWQRGIASKYMIMFAVPIISASLVKSRSLVIATTALASVAYALSTVRYFFDNYGQAIRVQLYGELVFFISIMFILAVLLMINFQPSKD